MTERNGRDAEFAERVTAELESVHSEEKKSVLPRFFKCGPGEYGEGDRFLGVVVPEVRKVAKRNTSATLSEIKGLLDSQWHEARLCALLILVARCRKSVPKEVFDFYLANTGRINNWDLVDLTAPSIVGAYVRDTPEERKVLYSLAESKSLWDQRIAVVSTLSLIRAGQFDETYALAVKLLEHKHDLMYKAVGWMLREAGKRDRNRLELFLSEHAASMPRTMLRYSIEKFPEPLRRHYLNL